MAKTLAANAKAHSMVAYADNVAAFLGQDLPSLELVTFMTNSFDFVGMGTLSPEAEVAGPQFCGFKEWYEAGDLEWRDGWWVRGVEGRRWKLVGSFFLR